MDIAYFLSIHPLDNEQPDRAAKPNPTVKANSDLGVFLSQYGINSFSDGFLRTIDYDALTELSPIWSWYTKDVIFFMRTAFGGLFYRKKSDYFFYDPLYDDTTNLANDLEFALNVFLCDNEALSSAFLFPLYNEAIKLIGVPNEDECFGFVPALKAGGQKVVRNLDIVGLKEHLYLLAQL